MAPTVRRGWVPLSVSALLVILTALGGVVGQADPCHDWRGGKWRRSVEKDVEHLKFYPRRVRKSLAQWYQPPPCKGQSKVLELASPFDVQPCLPGAIMVGDSLTRALAYSLVEYISKSEQATIPKNKPGLRPCGNGRFPTPHNAVHPGSRMCASNRKPFRHFAAGSSHNVMTRLLLLDTGKMKDVWMDCIRFHTGQGPPPDQGLDKAEGKSRSKRKARGRGGEDGLPKPLCQVRYLGLPKEDVRLFYISTGLDFMRVMESQGAYRTFLEGALGFAGRHFPNARRVVGGVLRSFPELVRIPNYEGTPVRLLQNLTRTEEYDGIARDVSAKLGVAFLDNLALSDRHPNATADGVHFDRNTHLAQLAGLLQVAQLHPCVKSKMVD